MIPPIEVYRIGDLHFVKDGHHSVSVAIATGQQMIDADVTEVLTQLPATGISRHSDLMRIADSGESASSPCSGPGQSSRVRAVPAPPTLPCVIALPAAAPQDGPWLADRTSIRLQVTVM